MSDTEFMKYVYDQFSLEFDKLYSSKLKWSKSILISFPRV
jgi:hypothetical protein